MFAVLSVSRNDASGRALLVQELDPDGRHSPRAVEVSPAVPAPEGWFFTNTPRGGSPPGSGIDLLTTTTDSEGIIALRYLHVRLD